MTGEPISTALLVSTAVSAGSTAIGLRQSRQQEKLETAMLQAETERARLESADRALVQSRNFRQALSSQLALASLRSGPGGSLVRQFGAESMGNFLADQRAIQNRNRFIEIASTSSLSQIRANRFSRDLSSIGSLLSSGLDAINLNELAKDRK